VTYLGLNGANAEWRIDGFALFWLNWIDKTSSDKVVNATFLEEYSGLGGPGSLEERFGIWAPKLVG